MTVSWSKNSFEFAVLLLLFFFALYPSSSPPPSAAVMQIMWNTYYIPGHIFDKVFTYFNLRVYIRLEFSHFAFSLWLKKKKKLKYIYFVEADINVDLVHKTSNVSIYIANIKPLIWKILHTNCRLREYLLTTIFIKIVGHVSLLLQYRFYIFKKLDNHSISYTNRRVKEEKNYKLKN